MTQDNPSDHPDQEKTPGESSDIQGQQKNQQYNPPDQGSSAPVGHLSENTLAIERRYGMSMTEEDRKKSFQIEDERWSKENQIKDWLKLGVMMIIMIVWMAAIYFLEPGLR